MLFIPTVTERILMNEIDIIIEKLFMLCVKYRKVLHRDEAWDIDSLLGKVWDEAFPQSIVSQTSKKSLIPNGDGYANGAFTQNGDGYAREETSYSPEREEEIRLLLEELRSIYSSLEEMGISQEEISERIFQKARLSDIHISYDGVVTLPLYGIQFELTPLQTAVYIFFMRHSEGILLKELYDYRAELLGILEHVYGDSYNISRVNHEVDRLADSTTGAMSENISRIRRAFIDAFHDREMARHYYIEGSRGTPFRIPLERSYVQTEE